MHSSSEHSQSPFTKPLPDSVNSKFTTALGRLHINGPVSPDRLAQLRLAEGLSCFRSSCRQHDALIDLAGEPDGLIFTASLANIIVSYVSFQIPDYPWWQKRCLPELLELGSIETDPAWRQMGLGNAILNNLFNNPDFTFFENLIVIAVQFIQSWDLKNSGMSPWAYRQLMIDLFKKYNFLTWETVDPEIREHPCNILFGRIGKNISPEQVTLFTSCCLGTE
jgi:acetoin utilization protein AcuA